MKVSIIYGTEVGTTQYVAEFFGKKMSELGHEVVLFQAGQQSGEPDLKQSEVVLIGSPTYYGGQPIASMGELISHFSPNLQKLKVAVFALGDQGYSHFCGAADVLETWVAHHGGTLLVPTLKIDGYPSDLTPLREWIELVVSRLEK
jgi:flavodoxin